MIAGSCKEDSDIKTILTQIIKKLKILITYFLRYWKQTVCSDLERT